MSTDSSMISPTLADALIFFASASKISAGWSGSNSSSDNLSTTNLTEYNKISVFSGSTTTLHEVLP